MNTIKTKKTSKTMFLVYIVMFGLLLAVNGLISFISADFDWSIIRSATYWFKSLTGASSGLFAFIIFALMRRDKLLITDEQYDKDIAALNLAIDGNMDTDFADFVANENRLLKIEAWKQEIQNKMVKWNNKVPARVLINTRLPRDQWRRRTREWMRKFETYEEQMSDEWIDKNINYMKILYASITVGEIVNGQKKPSTKKIIDNNAIGLILKERMPLIMINIALQIAYNAFIFYKIESTIAMWMAIVMQLFTIFINVSFGYVYGNTIFTKIDKNNLMTRRNFIIKYLKMKQNKERIEKAAPLPTTIEALPTI